jgi:hypothetical protein
MYRATPRSEISFKVDVVSNAILIEYSSGAPSPIFVGFIILP